MLRKYIDSIWVPPAIFVSSLGFAWPRGLESGEIHGDDESHGWLVVSTHSKNISQNGNLPQIGVKIKNIWNHHPDGIKSVQKSPTIRKQKYETFDYFPRVLGQVLKLQIAQRIWGGEWIKHLWLTLVYG